MNMRRLAVYAIAVAVPCIGVHPAARSNVLSGFSPARGLDITPSTRGVDVVSVFNGTLGFVRPGAAPPQAGQERKVVRLRTLSPGDVLYVLLGGGGNSLALIGEENVVLIDTKSPGWGQPIRDAVAAVTERPVGTIINTHAHIDHTGGNVDFPSATAIIAHENTKAAMEKMEAFKGANARFLPNQAVHDKMSLLDGRDRIELYYFGPGHTNGDLVVVFPAKRIAYFGDLFPSKSAPVIDVANGGSGVAFPETLARAVAQISGVTRVITGHEEGLNAERSSSAVSVDISTPRTMSWSDLQEYADFNREFLTAVQAAMKAGKTPEQAAASLSLPDRYRAYDLSRAKANVEAIYKELGAK
jgi:glyoxylase-like metal-dependent hydrolase (beta-lactamase superfamily II)